MRISHFAWNFGGLAFPLGVAVVTVPHLLDQLGEERFGLLALTWGLIGYAGSLDLGVGRALTQMVASLRGAGNLTPVTDVMATAGRITLLSGIFGGFLIALAALLGGGGWIKTESVSPSEIQHAMLLLAVALPAQAMSATYRGMNEAFLNFKGISLLRAGLGVVNFAGPYLISLFSTQLPWLVSALVVSRLLALVIYRRLALGRLQDENISIQKPEYSSNIARSLFSFGGWITVSSIVSPILLQADRFVIAATLSAAAVSVYVLPYEVVVQSLILVGAVSSVMFPGLGRLIQEKPAEWRRYFNTWLLRVGGMMAITCTALAFLLPVLLPLWIEDKLEPDSIVVGQILCLGVFANSLGSMFYALLHAKGRADITAKLHVVELPLFVVTLCLLLSQFGITGAAWAWVARMVFDALALAWHSRSVDA